MATYTGIYLTQVEYIAERAEALLDPWRAVRSDDHTRIAYGPSEQAAKDRLMFLIDADNRFRTFRSDRVQPCNGAADCGCW